MDRFDLWFALCCGFAAAAGMSFLAAALPRRTLSVTAFAALSALSLLAVVAVAGLKASFLLTFVLMVPVFALSVLATRQVSP